MSGFRQPELPREQLVLWAQQLDDAIAFDHPVRLFDLLLKSEAFRETFKAWEQEYHLREGQPPYHPRDLAGLYIYGMLNRIRSSRSLEMVCHNRIDFMWLLSNQRPDHATIAGFVARNAKRLRALFKDALKVSLDTGLATLDHVAYDGTKVAADAGKSSIRSQENIAAQLAGLDTEVQACEAEWQANEQRDNALLGADAPWTPDSGTMPVKLAALKRKQERLQKALKNIQRRQDESTHSTKPKAITSITDPDSRVMPSKEGGSRPNYNAQLGVDAKSGIIVAADVTDKAEDSSCLAPMLEMTQELSGKLPRKISADGSYNTGPNLSTLEKMSVVGYLPLDGSKDTSTAKCADANKVLSDAEWAALPREKKGHLTKDAFVYDSTQDIYRCPMGQSLIFTTTDRDRKNWGERVRRTYVCRTCNLCPRATECCSNPQRGRTVKRDQYEAQRERLKARMNTPEAQSRYDLRKQTVEPRFGCIKHVLGIRRFLRRGMQSVQAEWMGICTAVNFGVLIKKWAVVASVLKAPYIVP